MDADPCFVGPAPLIAAMCDAVDLVGVIDRLAAWDPGQCKLSPGTRIKALIVNILTARRPLYRVPEAFSESDVELILGAGAELDDPTPPEPGTPFWKWGTRATYGVSPHR